MTHFTLGLAIYESRYGVISSEYKLHIKSLYGPQGIRAGILGDLKREYDADDEAEDTYYVERYIVEKSSKGKAHW